MQSVQIPARKDVIVAAKAAGLRIAAVLPIHYPRALLRAFGFQPIEVWGPPRVESHAAASHFQAYACAIVRNASSFLLQGGLDPADVILIPHTCDALQGMASVLIDFLETSQRILTVYLPRDRRDSDLDYLAEELRRLGAKLGEVSSVTPSDAELLEAITREEAADAALAELALNRPGIALDDKTFYGLLRTREYLPAEQFTTLAESAPRGPAPTSGIPIMISGIVPEPMQVFDHINEAGGFVVADDLACCSRRLYPEGTGDDPYMRMAGRLQRCPADPTRGTPIPARADAIGKRIVESGARGLLIYDVKFCEPELFDIPLLRAHLNALDVPVLHLEFDTMSQVSGQAVTRIEAFVEMLQ